MITDFVSIAVDTAAAGDQIPSVAETKNGHWDSPLHRRCPNGPPGPEWKTS